MVLFTSLAFHQFLYHLPAPRHSLLTLPHRVGSKRNRGDGSCSAGSPYLYCCFNVDAMGCQVLFIPAISETSRVVPCIISERFASIGRRPLDRTATLRSAGPLELPLDIFVVILQFFDLPGPRLELPIDIFVVILQFFNLPGPELELPIDKFVVILQCSDLLGPGSF